jgi:hypothetical protein
VLIGDGGLSERIKAAYPEVHLRKPEDSTGSAKRAEMLYGEFARLQQEMEFELLKRESKASDRRLGAQMVQHSVTQAEADLKAAAAKLKHLRGTGAETRDVDNLLQKQEAGLLSGWADRKVRELDQALSAVYDQFNRFTEWKHCLKSGKYAQAERCFEEIRVQLQDADPLRVAEVSNPFADDFVG